MKHTYATLFLLVCTAQLALSQALSDFIVIDQFGYRPQDEKIAVIRDPQTGYDSDLSFTPGASYALVNSGNSQQVFTATPTPWNEGAEDPSSGDKAWWFDFSSVDTEGSYYILDIDKNVRSFEFDIRNDVYDEVLKHAVRTFFYQRVGFAKQAPFAETGWEDGASHIGPLQDKNARRYDAKTNPSTEKDVSGGWYDAGDYNKYTPWTSNYVYEMLQAYEENPKAWTDDYNLPESGNGRPDILDEALWGLNHLLRLQNVDGSMVAVVSESHASPPSAATGPSLYGGVNTSSTWNAASTFAYASKVFGGLGDVALAATCKQAAEKAWNWAKANPDVIWKNNDASYNSTGIGAGQQETDDYGRLGYRLRAAVHLHEISPQQNEYKDFFDGNYNQIHLMTWTFAYPFETREQEVLLYYTNVAGASVNVVSAIKSKYASAMNKTENLQAHEKKSDPYLAYIKDYGWGSNNTKSNQGNMFYDYVLYDINSSKNELAKSAAQKYIHYIHGVNPFNMTYLTNMYGKGAEKSANQIYHTWFADKSSLWDEVGVSTYGPAPGFLAGGPNPSYDWDNCCNSSCGGSANNALCTSMSIKPPKGQPEQKSYLDFNNNWPLNSWEVTENSCGYQIAYIRLLSKFVDRSDILNATPSDLFSSSVASDLWVYPNPASAEVKIKVLKNIRPKYVSILNAQGVVLHKSNMSTNEISLTTSTLKPGVYIISVEGSDGISVEKLVVE